MHLVTTHVINMESREICKAILTKSQQRKDLPLCPCKGINQFKFVPCSKYEYFPAFQLYLSSVVLFSILYAGPAFVLV